jgi:hypothetical protein
MYQILQLCKELHIVDISFPVSTKTHLASLFQQTILIPSRLHSFNLSQYFSMATPAAPMITLADLPCDIWLIIIDFLDNPSCQTQKDLTLLKQRPSQITCSGKLQIGKHRTSTHFHGLFSHMSLQLCSNISRWFEDQIHGVHGSRKPSGH